MELIVANTILEQLGGRRFIAMTGAKGFVGGSDFLTFSVGRNDNGVNKVKITLTAGDDYIVEGFRITKKSFVAKGHVEGVYCDKLRDVFTSITGLHTSL